MEINLGKFILWIRDFLGSNTALYNISLLLSSSVLLLLLFSPNDPSEIFPPPTASRFLWTPLIPILSSSCVAIWSLLSLRGQLDIVQTTIASIGVAFLVFLSLQFVTTSPVGVDGWFFLSNSQYFSRFGQEGTISYLSHTLVMYPVDLSIRTFGGSGRSTAAATGFIMSILWLKIVFHATSFTPEFQKKGVLLSAGLCLFFLLTAWYPLRYSAHLLGLLLGHFLIHRNPSKLNLSDLLIASLLAISHAFAPIVFGAMLFIESFLRKDNSERARFLALWISLIFIYWNTSLGLSKFSKFLPINDPNALELQISLSIPCILIFASSYLYERKMGKNRGDIFGGGHNTSNLSVVMGCIISIPVLLIGDTQAGASRFTHRLVTYSAVPLMWSGSWIMDKILEYTNSKSTAQFRNQIMSYGVVTLALINGVGVGMLQASFINNAQIMPEEAVHCWDMVEESGALGIINTSGVLFVISDQTLPPLKSEKFYSFLKGGDGSRITSTNQSKIVAFVETPDLLDQVAPLTNISFEEWEMISEVPSSCRLWVRPDVIENLDTSITWEALDAKYYVPE